VPELVVGREKRPAERHSLENGDGKAGLDGVQTKLKALRKAAGHALAPWMGGSEQLFGDAKNEFAVGSELHECLAALTRLGDSNSLTAYTSRTSCAPRSSCSTPSA
jgi:hypothetical protein